MDVLKKLHVNISSVDTIIQIPNYSNFLKEMLTEKRKLSEHEIVTLSEEHNAIIQNKISPKLKDQSSSTLHCFIGNLQGTNYLIAL